MSQESNIRISGENCAIIQLFRVLIDNSELKIEEFRVALNSYINNHNLTLNSDFKEIEPLLCFMEKYILQFYNVVKTHKKYKDKYIIIGNSISDLRDPIIIETLESIDEHKHEYSPLIKYFIWDNGALSVL